MGDLWLFLLVIFGGLLGAVAIIALVDDLDRRYQEHKRLRNIARRVRAEEERCDSQDSSSPRDSRH